MNHKLAVGALCSAAMIWAVACGGSSKDPPSTPAPEPDASAEEPQRDSGPPSADSGSGMPGDKPPDSGPIDDPLGLSDPFDGNSLASAWQIFHPEMVDITVSGGELHMAPNQNSVWIYHNEAPMIYKPVTGNFSATSRVRARKASDPSQYVGAQYQFGGLIARNGSTDKENYVFIVVGDRGETGLVVETKSSVENAPDIGFHRRSDSDAEVRICRINDQFLLYMRDIGDSEWSEAASHRRSDLPNTLQVGPTAYTYTDNPDLRASFEFIEFAPVSTEADCKL